MNIAQNLQCARASLRTIRLNSVTEWVDEFGDVFAYGFSDGSQLILGERPVVCSKETLQRWCENGCIDTILGRA